MRAIPLEPYQYEILNAVLSDNRAKGQKNVDVDGKIVPFKWDRREEYLQLRKKIQYDNEILFCAENDDIENVVMYLHGWEANLVVATNTPAIRNESFEKLQLVCKTIDYLDSFVEEVE